MIPEDDFHHEKQKLSDKEGDDSNETSQTSVRELLTTSSKMKNVLSPEVTHVVSQQECPFVDSTASNSPFSETVDSCGMDVICTFNKISYHKRKGSKEHVWGHDFSPTKNRCLEVTTTSCAKDEPGLEAKCKLECGNVDPGYALSTFDTNEGNGCIGKIYQDKQNVKDFQDVRKLEKSGNQTKKTSITHQNILVLNPKNNQKSCPVSDSLVIMHDPPVPYIDVESSFHHSRSFCDPGKEILATSSPLLKDKNVKSKETSDKANLENITQHSVTTDGQTAGSRIEESLSKGPEAVSDISVVNDELVPTDTALLMRKLSASNTQSRRTASSKVPYVMLMDDTIEVVEESDSVENASCPKPSRFSSFLESNERQEVFRQRRNRYFSNRMEQLFGDSFESRIEGKLRIIESVMERILQEHNLENFRRNPVLITCPRCGMRRLTHTEDFLRNMESIIDTIWQECFCGILFDFRKLYKTEHKCASCRRLIVTYNV